MPLLELLTSSNNRIILTVLQLINVVIQNNAVFRDSICLLGVFSFTTKQLFFSRKKTAHYLEMLYPFEEYDYDIGLFGYF